MSTNKILNNRLSPQQRYNLGMQKAEAERKHKEAMGNDLLPPPVVGGGGGGGGAKARRNNIDYYLALVKCFVCVMLVCLIRLGLQRKDQVSKKVTILIWNEELTTPLDQCGCIITGNRNYAGANFSAVVINADLPYSLKGLEHVQRKKNCLTVFSSQMPLSLVQSPLEDPLFNYTMTYRRDSNMIWTPYFFTDKYTGRRVHHFEADDKVQVQLLETFNLTATLRKKLFFSMYIMYEVDEYTRSESIYLEELRKHVDIAAYYACRASCSWYRFMLIFEPSACPEYVHPQFYTALENYVVPVYIGSANLSGLLPPGSYISSSQFASPKLLAKHLQQLSEKPKLYAQFFHWHSKYALLQNKYQYCALCRTLVKPRIQVLQPEQFKGWWTQYQCPKQTDRLDSSSSRISNSIEG